jgi:hypothetical protein
MTAVDGIPFALFLTSQDLRESMKIRGFPLQKAKIWIQNMVVEEGFRSCSAWRKPTIVLDLNDVLAWPTTTRPYNQVPLRLIWTPNIGDVVESSGRWSQ